MKTIRTKTLFISLLLSTTVLSAMEEEVGCEKKISHNMAKFLNATDKNDDTALMHTVKGCKFGRAELLIKARADITRQNKHGETVLMIASKIKPSSDCVNFLKLLLAEKNTGEFLDATDENGDTALMCAVKNRYLTRAELLIEAGSDFTHQNRNGESVLMILGPSDAASTDLIELLFAKAA